jgi:hypothetical protein
MFQVQIKKAPTIYNYPKKIQFFLQTKREGAIANGATAP